MAGAAFAIGLNALYLIPKEPPSNRDVPRRVLAAKIDWLGAFLFTSGLLLLLTGVSEGASVGWNVPFVIAILAISVVLLGAFIFLENYLEQKTIREPLIRLSTFSHGRYSIAMIIVTLFSCAFMNFLTYSTYL